MYVGSEVVQRTYARPQNLMNQDHAVKAHATLAQIQLQAGESMAALGMASICYGATSIGMWEDGAAWSMSHVNGMWKDKQYYTGLPSLDNFLRKKPWIMGTDNQPKRMKNLEGDIQKMLNAGIIQAPYLNGFWTRVTSNVSRHYSGTRIVGKQAYVIVTNLSKSSAIVTMKYRDLHYNISSITDFLSGQRLSNAKVTSNTISVSVPAFGYKILKLEK